MGRKRSPSATITHLRSRLEQDGLQQLKLAFTAIRHTRVSTADKDAAIRILEASVRGRAAVLFEGFTIMHDAQLKQLRLWIEDNSKAKMSAYRLLVTLPEVVTPQHYDIESSVIDLARRARIARSSLYKVLAEWETLGVIVKHSDGRRWPYQLNPNFVSKLDRETAEIVRPRFPTQLRLAGLEGNSVTP